MRCPASDGGGADVPAAVSRPANEKGQLGGQVAEDPELCWRELLSTRQIAPERSDRGPEIVGLVAEMGESGAHGQLVDVGEQR
jgi:hypothetical protein